MAKTAISGLPKNATPWEKAEELTDATRALLYDPDIIRRTKYANEVDEKLLPLLAWERSVDLWWETQSESSRRYITDNSFELHRQKGTYDGMKRHLELAEAVVLKIESPPMMAFPSRDMNVTERADWLGRFQQVRTFRYRNRGIVPGAVFLTNQKWVGFSNIQTPQALYFVSINGYEYDGHHSFLWEPRDNSETPLTVWTRTTTEVDKTVTEYDWVVLPTNLKSRWFMGSTMEPYYCTSSDPLAERTISVYRDTITYQSHGEFFTSKTVTPSLRPVVVFSEHVLEQGQSDAADWYLDHPKAMMFPTFGRADFHVYDRLYLYEEGRGVTPMPPDVRMFLDHSYFQFPPFVSKVKAEVRLHLPPYAFHRYVGGYMMECSMEPYERAIAAARSASSARDKTLLDTWTWDTVQVGNSTYCGQYVCGQQART